MKEFKYKTTFSSQIRCLKQDEQEMLLSKANLDNLKSIIPDRVKSQQDLLCIAANAFVANLGNLNGDMVSTESTLNFYKNFVDKGINLEHDRRNYCGHIVATSLSEFDNKYNIGEGSKVIEASNIKDSLVPFNVCIAGVVYKTYSEELTDLIEASNNPASEEYLKYGLSWELGYMTYSLAIGSKYLEKCKIIKDEEEVEKLSKYLLGNGGDGKLPDGRPIYRLVEGEILPLGVAITSRPAAAVIGITVSNGEQKEKIMSAKTKDMGVCPKCAAEIEMEDEMDDEMEMECAECKNKSKAKNWKIKANITNSEEIINKLDTIDKKFEETTKNLSQMIELVVKANDNNSTKIMKVKNINDLTDESLKEVKASEVQELFANSMKEKIEAEIKKISDDFEAKKTEKEKAIKAANDEIVKLGESVKANEDKYNAVQAELAKIKEEYDKLVKANEETQKLQVFSARMQTMDDEYNLSEEEKKIVGDELKTISTDEAFATYKAKMDVLLAKSKKVFDPKTKKWVNKEDVKKEEKTESKASTNVVAEVKKEEKVVTPEVPNTSTPTETIADKAKKAFGASGWDSKYIKNVEK